MTIFQRWIIALLAIMALMIAWGGRYDVHVTADPPALWRVDRLTGTVQVCRPSKCWDLPEFARPPA